MYAVIGFWLFRGDYAGDDSGVVHCTSLLECFFFHLDFGYVVVQESCGGVIVGCVILSMTHECSNFQRKVNDA